MNEQLSVALEREHEEIDAGIEAYTVGRESGSFDPQPLSRAMTALRRHIYLEEEMVFPPLRAAGMLGPILVMLREHGEIWALMDRLDLELSRSGDTTQVCAELIALLEAHNAKEEPIVYPEVDAVLSEQEAERLLAFLESGEMPEGWVATQARADRPATSPFR